VSFATRKNDMFFVITPMVMPCYPTWIKVSMRHNLKISNQPKVIGISGSTDLENIFISNT